MSKVNIRPLPVAWRKIPARLRPLPYPIFTGQPPTSADRELARELFSALDQESKAWYRRSTTLFDNNEEN